MHGRKLCSAGIHHVNVPQTRPVTRDHWNSYIRKKRKKAKKFKVAAAAEE